MAAVQPCSRASTVSGPPAPCNGVCSAVRPHLTRPRHCPLQTKPFVGCKVVAPLRAARAGARQAIVCAGETCSRRPGGMRGCAGCSAGAESGGSGRRGLYREARNCHLTLLFHPLLPAAAAVAAPEVRSMGADRWNDTYYPTGADAANVNKQVGWVGAVHYLASLHMFACHAWCT